VERPIADETDEALARRALQERAAFGVLYDRYVSRVYRYCIRRLGERADAEDATSAVFTRALERLPTYRGGSFPAWIFAIARSTVADRFRREMPERLGDRDEVLDPEPGPDEVAMAASDRLAVSALLALLPRDQREVLELRLAGLIGSEIASTMGRTVPAVKMLQLRAMKRLRAELTGARAEEE
jgi:RNA polymerase sigma-70 factor (ECF subfamily)